MTSDKQTPAEKALDQLALSDDVDAPEVEGYAIFVKIQGVRGDVSTSGYDQSATVQQVELRQPGVFMPKLDVPTRSKP